MGLFSRNWVQLADYEGHEINPSGQVRNIQTGQILKTSVNQSGVRYVSIRNTRLGRYENKAIGQLVAETFIGPHTDNAETVLHLDGNTENNAAENLMWATRWHAMAYHSEINKKDFSIRQRVKEMISGRVFNHVGEAAMATGCLPSQIAYAVKYNDALAINEHHNFVHKIFPGGHIFRSA